MALTHTGEPTLDTLPSAEPRLEPALRDIRDALRGLQYGSITVIVQDGVVVQIERTEKRRLRRV